MRWIASERFADEPWWLVVAWDLSVLGLLLAVGWIIMDWLVMTPELLAGIVAAVLAVSLWRIWRPR